jgi:IS30 family transposase
MKYEKWSPELRAKRLAKESEICVSHETIYKWIWTAMHSNHRDHDSYKKLYKHLRHNGRRQKINNIKDERLTNFDASWIKTITFDNGKEFARHREIAKDVNVKIYFTRPYTSQDKGSVENIIGVIRRFFPKKTDLRQVSVKRIKEVEKLLNYRPIRKFNYNNPIEVLNNKCVALMG